PNRARTSRARPLASCCNRTNALTPAGSTKETSRRSMIRSRVLSGRLASARVASAGLENTSSTPRILASRSPSAESSTSIRISCSSCSTRSTIALSLPPSGLGKQWPRGAVPRTPRTKPRGRWRIAARRLLAVDKPLGGSASACERPQGVRQDASQNEHVAFERRVDARTHAELVPVGVDGHLAGKRPLVGERIEDVDAEHFASGETERRDRGAVQEFEWEHTHPDEVRSMDALEALDEHCANPEELRPLR